MYNIATRPMRVVVVDDHEFVRYAVKKLFSCDDSIKIVGEAASGGEAVHLINQLQPDIAILDIRLGKGRGIEVAKAIKTLSPKTKILILTAYADEHYLKPLVALGVNGYLVKTISPKELKAAVHRIAQGELIYHSEVAGAVMSLFQGNGGAGLSGTPDWEDNDGELSNSGQSHWNLTTKQTEVLKQVACGLRNSEIANAMGIEVKTVEAHVKEILLKLRARNRTEAALLAMKMGWVPETVVAKSMPGQC